jgi:steroid delta-isomerase
VIDPILAVADRWFEAWNARDLPAVLSLFSEDVVFTSPKAASLTGSPTVRGKSALAAYWIQALARLQQIHFTPRQILHRENTLVIHYFATLNGQTQHALELFTFNPQGLIATGQVFYGAIITNQELTT